jgi:hypothetical protein
MVCLIIPLLILEPPKLIRQSSNIYAHLIDAGKKIWTNKKLKLLSANGVISFAIEESTYQFRATFIITLWPLWAVSFSKVLSSIEAAVSYWYGERLIRKMGDFRLLLISNIYGRVINIGSAALAAPISPVLLSSTSLFYGATKVANSTLMQKEFTDEQRATLVSVSSFTGSLAFGTFAIILGLFPDEFGPKNTLLLAYTFSLPTLLISRKLFKSSKGE